MSVLIKARCQIDMRSALMESDRVAGGRGSSARSPLRKSYIRYSYIYIYIEYSLLCQTHPLSASKDTGGCAAFLLCNITQREREREKGEEHVILATVCLPFGQHSVQTMRQFGRRGWISYLLFAFA